MALSKSTQKFGSGRPDLKEGSLEYQAKSAKEEVPPKIQEEEEKEREGEGGKGGEETEVVRTMDPNVANTVFASFPSTGLRNEEQNGRWTIKQEEMSSGDRGKEQVGFRRQDPKADSTWERRDGPGGRSGWVAKPVDGRLDVWVPPQDRDSRLAVLKSGSLYDIRSYKGETEPSRLYGEEGEAELPYRIPPEELSPGKAHALEAERQEVIKSQTVRKSTTVAERRSPGPSYAAVFAVCFDGRSPERGSASADPQNIDTEQIGFAAARQQFLALEKSNPGVLLRRESPRRAQTMPNVGRQAPAVPRETDHDQRGRDVSREQGNLWKGQGPVGLGKTHPGLKVVIIDERVSRKHTGGPLDPPACGEPEETPIEREIRLSLKREEDLWNERGIPRSGSRDELVEIRAKPLLWSSSSSTEGKGKPCVSFPVQREIEQDAKREEDLQKEGRLLGTYRRGERQQLAQRRKVFEQEIALVPACKAMISGAPGQPKLGTYDGERGVPCQDEKWKSEANGDGLFLSSPVTTRPMGSPRPAFPDSGDPGEGLAMQKAHFAVPVRKLRFSFADDAQAGGRGGLGRAAPPRHEAFTLKTWHPRTSALIDEEIRDALRRELELQEERRSAGPATNVRPSSPNSVRTGLAGGSPGCTSPALTPSSPRRLSALASPDRLPSRKPSPESSFPTCLSPSMRRREEGKYAGIELSDEIDTEVVRSTKAICRRGVLAQRWEAGQIRNVCSDDGGDDGDDGESDSRD